MGLCSNITLATVFIKIDFELVFTGASHHESANLFSDAQLLAIQNKVDLMLCVNMADYVIN